MEAYLHRLKDVRVFGLVKFDLVEHKLHVMQRICQPTMHRLYWFEYDAAADAIVSLATMGALQCLLDNENQNTVTNIDKVNLKCVTIFNDSFYYTLVCDKDYSIPAAMAILRKWPTTLNVVNDNDVKLIEYVNRTIQNPANVDVLLRVQSQTEELKTQLHGLIDQAIERNCRLEDLEKRSKELDENALRFYKGAKKLNRCCPIL